MRRRSGFTLVEVMVVMAVTALLSGLILVYNASTRETLRLFTEKARVAQLVFRAKSLALSTYVDGGQERCGYGVRFDRAAGTYALVSYAPPSCADRSQVRTNPEYFESVQLSSFTLPTTLEFRDRADAGTGAGALSYVLFIPPDPTVLLARDDGSLITAGDGEIRIGIKDRETDAIVSVNGAGQVTF